MKHLKILVFALVAMLASCGSEEGGGGSAPTEKTTVDGIVEKGPFVQGSKVTLYDLDGDMTQTGLQFVTTTSNDLGNFAFNSPIKLSGHYAELETSGYFYNECDSSLSRSQITLRAITDLSRRNSVNVNIVTHLEFDRVKKLVRNGSSFADAKRQAETEIMKVFAIPHTMTDPENTSLTSADDNAAALLAISAIMLADRTEAEFTEVLAKFCADFKDNGVIDTKAVRDSIASGQKKCHPGAIARAMKRFYAEKGSAVQVSDFAKFVDFNGDGVIDSNDKEDEWMEIYPDVVIPENTIVNSESNVRAVMASVYRNTMQCITLLGGLDERRLTDGHAPLNASDGDVYKAWEAGYKAINNASQILYALKNHDTNYDRKPYIDEASALLAFLYYNMATEWGTVLYLDPEKERTPESILNAQIMKPEQMYKHCLTMLADAHNLKNEPYHVTADFVAVLQTEINLASGKRSEALNCLKRLANPDADIFCFYTADALEQPLSPVGIYTKPYITLLEAEACGKAFTPQQLLERKGRYGTFAALQRSGYLDSMHERLLPIPEQELLFNMKLKQNEGY